MSKQTLREQAEMAGTSVNELVAETVRQTRSINGAAKALGVQRSAIRYRLGLAGLKAVRPVGDFMLETALPE